MTAQAFDLSIDQTGITGGLVYELCELCILSHGSQIALRIDILTWRGWDDVGALGWVWWVFGLRRLGVMVGSGVPSA